MKSADTPVLCPGHASPPKDRRALRGTGHCVLLAGLLANGTSCASVEVMDAATGLPRVIGCGSVTNIPVAQGTICRIRSPGFSLRLHPYDPGLTFGWHETLLFLPERSPTNSHELRQPAEPVAILSKDYGLGVAPFQLMIGREACLGVYQPKPGLSIRQSIQFNPECLTNTTITQEVIQ